MSTSQTEPAASKTVTYFRKPERSFWQIWNMSFGFLGIQFGWGLQMANMSAIYGYLGANPDSLAILWLAAPVTGVIIQPLIGQSSDRMWTRLGRRRPTRRFMARTNNRSVSRSARFTASMCWRRTHKAW